MVISQLRIWRKRQSSASSDDGAPEVVVDTADKPPTKRACLQEQSPVTGYTFKEN
ncbi:hypothetical protein DPMN_105189 [Dreissena polymorpha]|uniref:Uncharacterized protein n=1 Tax=Dreissena polymorpha TaxID=45954 RepID=A0A9D4HGH6_DREPO|nr:hypothetical protein DPMN_105189 [Dreissena polymorpha]